MSCIREVITLQVGHYSNFVGTHWLNLQEASFVYDQASTTDINHDILFREGKLPNNQECYVPRLLIVDAKGSLGSLPQSGTLYGGQCTNPSSSHAIWSGKVDLHSHSPEEKNDFLKALEVEDAKYQENVDEDKDICLKDSEMPDATTDEWKIFDLSEKVKVWSDFLRPHLHPKTVFLLDDVPHREIAGATNECWGFADGADVFRREKTEEELMDRVRLMAESCGSLQGFQLLCDIHDGMSGVGAGLLQSLADDYSSKDVFTFAPSPPHNRLNTSHQRTLYLTNLIQAYAEFSHFSSLVVPLSLNLDICQPASDVVRWPHVSYKKSSPYESSSILASFLETASVAWRAKSNPVPLSCLADVLTPLQRKVVGGCFACPIGLSEDAFLRDWLGGEPPPGAASSSELPMEYTSVGGGGGVHAPRLVEVSTIRGIAKSRLESGPKRLKFDTAWQLYEHFLAKEDEALGRSVTRGVFGIRDPLRTTAPFPQVFTTDVTDLGFVRTAGKPVKSLVTNVPAAANLQQGDGVLQHLQTLAQAGARIDVAKLPSFAGGDAVENWKGVLEAFFKIAEVNRHPNYDSDETDSD